MAFSYKHGVKIAKILTKGNDDKYIYLSKDTTDPIKKLSKKFKFKHSKLSKEKIKELHTALRNNKAPLKEDLKKIYDEALTDIKDITFDCLDLENGEMQVIPRKDIVEKLYISGVSGSGKSTYTGKYIKQFKQMFKEDPLYVFSSVAQDEALDKHEPIRIPLDTDLIDDPLEIEDFTDSLTIFDDTDTIRNKELKKIVNDVKAEMIEIGRHHKARMIVTSHILSNYKDTRQILNECTSITFFPRASGPYHIKRFLKIYAGLSNNQITRILDLPSRWVTLYKCYPSYIVWEKGICLVSAF